MLADPRFHVPAAPAAALGTGSGPGMAWLRGAVSRFANGPEHARRRSRAQGLLDALDPVRLRGEARERTRAELAGGAPVDVMARIARRVPVGVLATRLGVPGDRREEVVAAVTAIAAAYHLPSAGAPPGREAADAAVGVLADALGGGDAPEPGLLAAVAGVLVQACDATAGLVGNALAVVARLPATPAPGWRAEALLAEILRWDPPVRLTRRVAAEDATAGGLPVPAGAVLVLDLAAANRDPEVFPDPHRFDPYGRGRGGRHLGFGDGIRPCPGEDAALALAAGVVEAAAGHRLADPRISSEQILYEQIPYEPSRNLRVPASLWLAHPEGHGPERHGPERHGPERHGPEGHDTARHDRETAEGPR